MRKIILTLTLCLTFGSVFAQKFSQAQALKEINEAAASIKTMQCDFVQTKSLKMLGDKMISKGQMCANSPICCVGNIIARTHTLSFSTTIRCL